MQILDCAGGNFVKRILGQCTICRKFEGKPYRAPLPPPLPTFRVEESPPFAHMGVDFAGPLYVKKVDSTARKVWICLFTCLCDSCCAFRVGW